MRRSPPLSGYVITELHDCHWESNGLLDMRRNRRVFHGVFRTINADTVIAPRWDRLSYWAGETAEIEVAVAHGAGAPIEGGTLEIRFGDDLKRFDLPRIEAGQVLDLGRVALRAPDGEESSVQPVRLFLRASDGTELATNRLDAAVFPVRPKPAHQGQRVWSPDEKIRERFAALGYGVARSLEDAT